MTASTTTTPVSLTRRQTYRLKPRHGTRIVCRGGLLWITQDGDRHDWVLTAGDAVTLEHGRATVVSAMSDARFAVEAPVAVRPSWPRWLLQRLAPA